MDDRRETAQLLHQGRVTPLKYCLFSVETLDTACYLQITLDLSDGES